MSFRVLGLCVLSVWAASSLAQTPAAGLVITKNARLKGGTYTLPNDSSDPWTGTITIQGDNITVDFKGVTLMGTPENTPPDKRKGTGIRVTGKNVTIKNARVRGYMVGLIAQDAPGLKIFDSDFSYNYKQRLKSTIERENEDDWQYYHQNEKDEWLRYGAGIYLRGCDNFEVKNCNITGGQCGLMLVGSNNGLAWNNNFIFLSGIGVGLYRSNENKIIANSLDWCVRGYSHGYYSRGQDSSAILIYEQSNKNTFAFNSATHSGDGFFLWAGQTTMDKGEGGCNDNFVYGNDFSFACANGIETTFSRNTFANNMAQGCDYGVWGGYSYDSKFLGNWISDNRVGIAIEHGQNNAIRGNYLMRNKTGVQLWANAIQDSSWGYPKFRDTASHGYEIAGNLFSRSTTTFDIRDTKDARVTGNRLSFPGVIAKDPKVFVFESNRVSGMGAAPDGFATGNTFDQVIEAGLAPDWDPFAKDKEYPAEIKAMKPELPKGAKDMFTGNWIYPGRINIIVDEWGPYDFQYPKLWPNPPDKDADGQPAGDDKSRKMSFRIMGPPGTWVMKKSTGVTESPQNGDVPGDITVTVPSEQATAVDLQMIYTSTVDVIDYLGVKHKAGSEVPFRFKQFFVPMSWTTKLFAWDEKNDPRTKADAFAKLIAGQPLHTATLKKLQFGTSGSFFPNQPRDRFATVSEGTVELPPGNYDLEVTSDDGVRVWIDGKKVIDVWQYQAPTTFTAPITGGKHKIKVQHFEIDGYAALVVEVKPAADLREGA